MNGETDGHFVEVLNRIVREARELQRAGRLRDSLSRTEVTMLEHELRVLQARLAADAVSDRSPRTERATAVVSWARAVMAASEATRGHSRRLRKDLYRARLISGPGDD